MQWLTALLAFATTMLIFAIIVSTLVELIHRAFRLRSQGMRLMLESLYVRVIEPHLDDDQKSKSGASDFADIIMENRAVGLTGESPPQGRMAKLLHRFIDSSTMTDIPVEVFTQKLADSRIVGKAENFTDEVLRDIAQKYESFGHEAGVWFGRRARMFSVCVAFVVVWLFHVHPYNLAVTYFRNPQIAENVANQAAASHAQFESMVERQQDALEELSQSPVLQQPDEQGGGSAERLQASIDDVRQALDDARAQTLALASLGVPLGWPAGESQTIPPCFGSASVEQDSDAGRKALTGYCLVPLPWLDSDVTLPSPANALWLVLGGLLVGLGAPFWAKAVAGLSTSRDLSRRIGQAVGGAQETSMVRSRARGATMRRAPETAIPVAVSVPIAESAEPPTSVSAFRVSLSRQRRELDGSE